MTLRTCAVAVACLIGFGAGRILFGTEAVTCCSPDLRWEPTAFTYQFEYDSGVSYGDRETFEDRINSGSANRWNDMFYDRNHAARVTFENSSSATVKIDVSANYQDLQWSCHPSCGTEGAHTVIEVPLDWVDGTRGHDDVIGDLQHEFGHRLGFAQGCTGESIMGDPYPGISDFTNCDLETFNGEFGPPDWDGDGWQNENDCSPNDPNKYPGAPIPCYCWELESGFQDHNCDSTDDHEQCMSPIVVDVRGNGFALTSAANGVMFDLQPGGAKERIPWTDPAGDDAWLTLDRNSNGTIDDGTELFGNFSPQPPSNDPNGFEALAVFDRREAGGNENGSLDSGDAVYTKLRLWHDGNQDGSSRLSELSTLDAARLRSMSLDYREFRRVDQFGNWFRLGARISDGRGRDIGPWAFDVYFGLEPPRHVPRDRVVARLRAGSSVSPRERLSPRRELRSSVAGANIRVEYGSPFRRGREIWGNLVPWRRVWMPGADEATTFETDRMVEIGGLTVEPGRYSMYLLVDRVRPLLIINRQVGQGHLTYTQKMDLGRVPVTVRPLTERLEQLTFDIGHGAAPHAATLQLLWDDRVYSVPMAIK